MRLLSPRSKRNACQAKAGRGRWSDSPAGVTRGIDRSMGFSNGKRADSLSPEYPVTGRTLEPSLYHRGYSLAVAV